MVLSLNSHTINYLIYFYLVIGTMLHNISHLFDQSYFMNIFFSPLTDGTLVGLSGIRINAGI